MISMVTRAGMMSGRSARSSTVIRRVGMPQVVLTPHLIRLPNEPLRALSGHIPGAARYNTSCISRLINLPVKSYINGGNAVDPLGPDEIGDAVDQSCIHCKIEYTVTRLHHPSHVSCRKIDYIDTVLHPSPEKMAIDNSWLMMPSAITMRNTST